VKISKNLSEHHFYLKHQCLMPIVLLIKSLKKQIIQYKICNYVVSRLFWIS